MNKLLATFVFVVLLVGCSSGELPPAKYVAPPSNKIVLNVATIDIVDHSGFQPSDSPYNTYHLEPTITQVVHKWVADTLQAGGTSGQAIVVLQDASLSTRAISTSDDLTDKWFKRQQASKYTGHISVQMELRSGTNYGFVGAEATHFITLPEEPTATERQNAYVDLLNNLTKDFRKNFDASIHDHAQWALITNP